MGALITASIRVDKLPKEKFIKGKKDQDGNIPVYYDFTIAVQDETRYGNNVALMDSRTQEEREAKKKVDYLGNGKVVWIKDVKDGQGVIQLAERKEKTDNSVTASAHTSEKSDLPF